MCHGLHRSARGQSRRGTSPEADLSSTAAHRTAISDILEICIHQGAFTTRVRGGLAGGAAADSAPTAPMTAIVATSSRLRIIYSARSSAAAVIAPAFDAIVWSRRVGSTVRDRPGHSGENLPGLKSRLHKDLHPVGLACEITTAGRCDLTGRMPVPTGGEPGRALMCTRAQLAQGTRGTPDAGARR